MKLFITAALLSVTFCSCSMGLKYDSKGDVEGYTAVSKINLEEK